MSYRARGQFLAVFVLILLLSAGCTRWNTPIQTWEGEGVAGDGVAVLEVPGNLRLLSVDDRDMPRYLVESADFVFHLLPGERRLQVRYDALFATADGGRKRQAATVRSEPIEMVFTARPGATYFLVSEQSPASRRGAEIFARCPTIVLQDESSDRIAQAGCRQSD